MTFSRSFCRDSAKWGKKKSPSENTLSMNDPFAPLNSLAENGHSVRISIRPARDSDRFGSRSTSADPVRRKRPGRRSRSTWTLMAGKSSGACCTSSRTTGPSSPDRKPVQSSAAAASTVASSKVRYRPPLMFSVYHLASVLLPVWRAPLSNTTGVSAMASVKPSDILSPNHGVIVANAWLIC